MQAIVIIALIAITGGLAVGIQSPLANLISTRLGTLESVFIIHIGGAVAALIPLLLLQGGGKLAEWRTLPWYSLVAGVLGVIVISAVTYTIPRIGVTGTILLVVAGQMVIGVGLDHFGILVETVRPIDLSRVLGIVIMMAGVWLIVR